MNNLSPETLDSSAQTVVAVYRNHPDAEAAVRLLSDGGLSVSHVSIIGRNFETHEDVQGFYRPADAVAEGAKQGAWYGGLFGLMMGAMGVFVFPAVGALIILGPLSSIIAGAIGGAGVGALTSGLIALGIPHKAALLYQERLHAGEFLVVIRGNADEAARAHAILDDTAQVHLAMHAAA